MATPAHCIYCFEILSSSLERRQPLKLAQVEALWSEYDLSQVRKGQPSLDTPEVDGEDSDDGADGAQDGDLDVDMDGDDEDEEEEGEPSVSSLQPRFPTHLAVPSPLSSSSSSTPLSASAASSIRGVKSPSDSKSSSRSSFFSPIRRLSPRPALSPRRQDHHPLFVTWSTVGRHGGKSLRGCIGTFEPQELASGLRSYALTSAFQDTRFSPITASEFPSLSCSVTLLTDFTSAPTPLAWTLGTHGIRISFTHNARRYGATYLPDVPLEQGWTKEETMVSLMRKAGWNGKSKDWRLVGNLKVVRYRGRKVTVTYQDWRSWRAWAESRRV